MVQPHDKSKMCRCPGEFWEPLFNESSDKEILYDVQSMTLFWSFEILESTMTTWILVGMLVGWLVGRHGLPWSKSRRWWIQCMDMDVGNYKVGR